MSSLCVAALIVAAGRGNRAGGDIPKQWQVVAGKRVIDWTLAAFHVHPQIAQTALVLHPDDMNHTCDPIPNICVAGGTDRAASVRAGLDALRDTDATHVLIHDVARPCVSAQVVSAVIDALGTTKAAAPALAVTDALWRGEQGFVTGTETRAGLYRAQTPQGFELRSIADAHANHPGGAADDVEVARAAGLEVQIVPGEEDNLKITLPEDFDRAARILERK